MVDTKGKGRADGSRVNGKALAAEEVAKRDAELRAMFVVVPPGDEAKPISCPICKEPLKSEFLEDDEEWVWRNAVKKDDRVCRRSLPISFLILIMFISRYTMRLAMRRLSRPSRVLLCACGMSGRAVADRGPPRRRRHREYTQF